MEVAHESHDSEYIENPFKQQFANLILSNFNKAKNFEFKKTPGMLIQATGKAITEANYGNAIASLMELIDTKQNIYWHIKNSTSLTNREMLIRDARSATSPEKGPEAYIIMGLHYIRTARALMGDDIYKKAIGYFNFLASNFYIKLMETKDETKFEKIFGKFNSAVVHAVAYRLGCSFDEAAHDLAIAKDFVNLEDPSRDIVTISTLCDQQGNKITVFQADSPVTALTDDLKEYIKSENMQWVQSLSLRIQRLIKGYISDLKGDKVQPTQTRYYLPGLRNRYFSIYGILEMNSAKVTASGYHSGAIVSFVENPNEIQRLNRLHGEQLKQSIKEKQILILTLNTFILDKDKPIINGSRAIADTNGFFYSNLAVNIARYGSKNHNEGINSILSIVANQILVIFKDLAKEKGNTEFVDKLKKYLLDETIYFWSPDPILYHIKNVQNFRNSVAKNDPKLPDINSLCEILIVAIHTRSLTMNNFGLDPDNKNLFIAAYTNILIHLLQKYIGIAVNSSCESGKDRTGLLMFLTALLSFVREIFNINSLQSNNEAQQLAIKMAIIGLSKSRHQNFLAGCQGGGVGNFGIKEDSKDAIPKNQFPEETAGILVEKTASYNKAILVDKEKPIYFPISNNDYEIQRYMIAEVLKIQNYFNPHALFKNTIANLATAKSLEHIKTELNTLISQLESTSTFMSKSNNKSTLTLLNTIVHHLDFIDFYPMTLTKASNN